MNKVKIEIITTDTGMLARVDDEIFASGKTGQEALGKLVLAHGDLFGADIRFCEDSTP